ELIAGSGDKITADTLFKIASNSKAMTAAVLARLVDAGKLRWDDPVVRHLPQFAMFDPWVSAHMQVQDLLVHNSGLPEGGGDLMLWPEPNDYTRADIINGLRYIKPAYSFRSGYAYDNLLYVVAGEVAAAVAGTSYEDLVRAEVFEPLGLGCRVGEWRRDEVANVAQPHSRVDGHNTAVHPDGTVVPAITSAAAGGIRCSLNDMLAWAANWLAPGATQEKWLSREQRQAMWTPHTQMPISVLNRRWNDTHYYAYALGFRAADVDGAWTVSHTGTLMGMYSVMYLLPDSNSGFVMLTNGQGGDARTVMSEVLLKQLIGKGSGAAVQHYADEIDAERAARPPVSRAPDTSSRVLATRGDAGLQTGVWRDPWFGETSVCERDGSVRFVAAKSPLLRGTVMRVGDRLLVDWDKDSVDAEAWLDFASAPDTRLTM
ncbi:MAG: serine hydrolase, partial [Halioglobus sp.]|nr:serine hydrolase [Halioglobus sp.]